MNAIVHQPKLALVGKVIPKWGYGTTGLIWSISAVIPQRFRKADRVYGVVGQGSKISAEQEKAANTNS